MFVCSGSSTFKFKETKKSFAANKKNQLKTSIRKIRTSFSLSCISKRKCNATQNIQTYF